MRKLINILLLLIAGCIPPTHIWFTTYTVPAGQHYSIPRAVIPIPTNLVRWSFKTNDTWIWEQSNSGFSKIGGIYWFQPHDNSVRVVVRNWKGQIEAWFYIYEVQVSPQQDKRLKGKICNLEINKTYEVVTGWSDGHFIIELNGILTEIETDWEPDSPAGFDAPYIGGTYTINHKWKVPIKFN